MPKLVYRVVSSCGALGSGYPKESLEVALQGRGAAIVSEGGAVNTGPTIQARIPSVSSAKR